MRPADVRRQAYDLWKHNCNNFSDSFATFLVGKGIPDHILHMPQAVLDSPMGRMLLPQLTQNVNASRQTGSILGIQDGAGTAATANGQEGKVRMVGDLSDLDAVLEEARTSCAVVFFTSATCPPCKTLYPLYDQLAAEFGNKCHLAKVDVGQARDTGTRYSISATPTFITFLKGERENTWSGADPAQLRRNTELLVQMAWPTHPHSRLNLPSFASAPTEPVTYAKVPPIPKLLAKMGSASEDPAVKELTRFIEAREKEGAAMATLPDVKEVSRFIQQSVSSLPLEVLFSAVDLFRCALADPRISGYFAEEPSNETVSSILERVNGAPACPYALRLVTLQMACNLFTSPLYADEVLAKDTPRAQVISLVSTSFLDDAHANTRVAAASLMFNLVLAHRRARDGRHPHGRPLPEADQVELAASVLEAVGQEEGSAEALRGMLSALGHLVYGAPVDGELADLLCALEAGATVKGKTGFPEEKLVTEVGELLSNGFRRP